MLQTANPSSACTVPDRKEYRSERVQFVRGCFLRSGCFAEDLVAFSVFTHPPIPHTLLPLNSFQTQLPLLLPAPLTWPSLKWWERKQMSYNREFRGRGDSAGTGQQHWGQTARRGRTRTSFRGNNRPDNILAKETPLGEAAAQGDFFMLSRNRIK